MNPNVIVTGGDRISRQYRVSDGRSKSEDNNSHQTCSSIGVYFYKATSNNMTVKVHYVGYENELLEPYHNFVYVIGVN